MTAESRGDTLPEMPTETLTTFTRKQLAENDDIRAQAYARWKRDPASVEESVAAFLEGFETGASSVVPVSDDEARRFAFYRSAEFAKRLTEAFARAKEQALDRAEALLR